MSVALLPPTLLSHLSSGGDTSKLYLTSKCQGEPAGPAGKSARLVATHAADSEEVSAHQLIYKLVVHGRNLTVVLCVKWALSGHAVGQKDKVQVVSDHSLNLVIGTFFDLHPFFLSFLSFPFFFGLFAYDVGK